MRYESSDLENVIPQENKKKLYLDTSYQNWKTSTQVIKTLKKNPRGETYYIYGNDDPQQTTQQQ